MGPDSVPTHALTSDGEKFNVSKYRLFEIDIVGEVVSLKREVGYVTVQVDTFPQKKAVVGIMDIVKAKEGGMGAMQATVLFKSNWRVAVKDAFLILKNEGGYDILDRSKAS